MAQRNDNESIKILLSWSFICVNKITKGYVYLIGILSGKMWSTINNTNNTKPKPTNPIEWKVFCAFLCFWLFLFKNQWYCLKMSKGFYVSMYFLIYDIYWILIICLFDLFLCKNNYYFQNSEVYFQFNLS